MTTLPELLEAVRDAARDRRQADAAYRSALLSAFEELEETGAPNPYAQLAAAAGITRQAARETVSRARASW